MDIGTMGVGGRCDSSEEGNLAQEPSPSFTVMMDFMCEWFLEARGSLIRDTAPLLPGMERGEVPVPAPHLIRASPMNFMMEQASSVLTWANETIVNP